MKYKPTTAKGKKEVSDGRKDWPLYGPMEDGNQMEESNQQSKADELKNGDGRKWTIRIPESFQAWKHQI